MNKSSNYQFSLMIQRNSDILLTATVNNTKLGIDSYHWAKILIFTTMWSISSKGSDFSPVILFDPWFCRDIFKRKRSTRTP